MTILQETADVARPVGEAFAYVSDFTTTTEWDTTAQRARKLTPGKIRVGTEFEVVCAMPVGSVTLLYRVSKLEQDALIELEGSCSLFSIRDQITFAPSERGTRIEYRAEFDFKPIIKPFAGLSKSGLEKMGRESVAGLAEALEDNYPAPEVADSASKPNVCAELPRFTRLGFSRASGQFNPMSASVRDKHIVVTGASAGLGYTVAQQLANRGARLTLVMRNPEKARRTVEELQAETGNNGISYEIADLSLMSEVEKLVARLLKKGRAIDVLINNAGALFNPRGVTAEGLEQSYALLLLSPWRLTLGLKPLLSKSPAPRVINVVSGGMYSQRLNVSRLMSNDGENYSGSVAYARQKRALMVVTEEWAREWAEEGIVVNAMHPGWADTPGVQDALPLFRRVTRPVLRSSAEGADTIVWLAIAREAAQVSGKLFLDRQVRSPYLLDRTRESKAERARLLDFLADWDAAAQAG